MQQLVKTLIVFMIPLVGILLFTYVFTLKEKTFFLFWVLRIGAIVVPMFILFYILVLIGV